MKYADLIRQMAAKHGVDPDLAISLVSQESSGNPNALSIKGAKGLSQLMDRTGMDYFNRHNYGKVYGSYDPLNPEQNLDVGLGYLKEQLDRFGGNEDLALAAYNGGPTRVSNLLNRYGNKLQDGTLRYEQIANRLPGETQDYVTKIKKGSPSSEVRGALKEASEEKIKEVVRDRIQEELKESVLAKLGLSGGGSSGLAADTAVASTADGGVMLANGSTVPGVATSMNGGTVLADGSIVGGTPAAPGMFSLSGIGGAGNAILPVAGAFGAKHVIDKWGRGNRSAKGIGKGALQGGASGAAMGSYFGPVGTIVGAVLGTVGGVAGTIVKAGKHKDQLVRDGFRSQAQQAGIIGDDYKINFSDGGSFDVGKDGGYRLKNVGENIDGKTERNNYDVDFSNPLAKNSIGKIQDILNKKFNPDAKHAEQNVGMYVNAVTEGAKDQATVDSRIKELATKFGISDEPGVRNTMATPGTDAMKYRSDLIRQLEAKYGSNLKIEHA